MNEVRIFFNCIPWAGNVLVQGNNSFFKLLADCLDSVSDKTLSKHYDENCLTISDKVDIVVLDIRESNACVDPSWASEYTEDSFFFRFHGVNQLTVSRRIAFEIGDKVRAGMNKISGISKENTNALYAFSRVIQNCS